MPDPFKVAPALICVALAMPSQTLAQESQPASPARRQLTESEVIRLVLANEPHLRAAHAEVQVAQAQIRDSELRDNPSLGWQREAFPSSQDSESEDAIALAWPLDLSGRRTAKSALARASLELTRAELERERGARVARALEAFYDAIAQQQRAAIAEAVLTRLSEARRVMSRRHEEGAVSGYEALRLELEVELAASHAAQAAGAARRAREGLAVLLGVAADSPLELSGSLVQSDDLPLETRPRTQRPSQQRMSAALSALERAADAADGDFIPRIELEAGVRIGSSDRTRYGYLAGVQLELPLLSHGQALAQEASARRAAVRDRMAAEVHDSDVVARRALSELTAARGELTRLRASVETLLPRLDQAALSSYREGAQGLYELIDAQRTRSAVEQRLLELEFRAKRAEIALRAARGEFQ